MKAQEFAQHIKGLGFRVFLAKSGNYGFITDATGSRVLSFSFDFDATLSGNYGPASRESGTGWRLEQTPYDLQTAADVSRALNENPPAYCGRGWKYFSTLEQHLATYQASSQYTEVL